MKQKSWKVYILTFKNELSKQKAIINILPFLSRFFAYLTVSMETRTFEIQKGGQKNYLKAKLILFWYWI